MNGCCNLITPRLRAKPSREVGIDRGRPFHVGRRSGIIEGAISGNARKANHDLSQVTPNTVREKRKLPTTDATAVVTPDWPKPNGK
jgi:hypothetical protein